MATIKTKKAKTAKKHVPGVEGLHEGGKHAHSKRTHKVNLKDLVDDDEVDDGD
ncbi:MAG: hypothetical protein IJL17_11620 [Kiritimatiellae bacterium]|nr:hypothetical protein [Kiritimatiellia bacterium]